jgi:hypothetical protein
MKEQHFKNHSKYIIGFHIVTLAIIVAALIISINLLVSEGIHLNTVFALLTAASLALLFAFVRQFAVGNQDRIIRAEETARSYRLTGKELDSRLTRSQVIALRLLTIRNM